MTSLIDEIRDCIDGGIILQRINLINELEARCIVNETKLKLYIDLVQALEDKLFLYEKCRSLETENFLE